MRILHIISTLDPSAGGPPVIAVSIATAQRAQGHDVTIMSRQLPKSSTSSRNTYANIPSSSQVNFHAVPARNPLFYPLYFTQDLTPTILEADFLHLHGVWDPIVFGAALIARRENKPYTIQIHGMLDPWSMGQRTLKKKFALMVGYKKLLDRAAFLHCGNRDEVELIKPMCLNAPTEIIGNGFFLESLEDLPAKGSYHSSLSQVKSAPYILFMSRLHLKKGLDYLADAFAIVHKARPDVHLVVAGPDQGEQAPFESRIEQLGLSDSTHLVGPVYGPVKYGAIQDAAVFCLPSRQEGFSIAITEALSIGTPVVISEPCHFPEVAEVNAGFVTPLDPKVIADSLLQILNNPELAKQMGENGRKLIRDRFTWDKIASQLITAYQRHM